MPDLLLEIFCEEIPARMQRRAADDLRRLVTDGLVEAGLAYEGAKAFVTPRRLALTVHGVPARSPDQREERKGPRVGAPDKAIAGFVKAAGLASIDEAIVQPDKKGDIYVAVIDKPGRAAEEVVGEIVPAVIRDFPWPKSMRWGARSQRPGSLAWVRPLHAILCTFGPETEEPEVVAFEVDGIRAGNTTYGHRFMAPEPIVVRRFDDYVGKLEDAKVVLDPERRKDLILYAARDQALALGLELVEDDALADEVAGLVEWPVVLVGSFEPAFLDLPPEVVRTTIRNNQKCFVLQEARSAPRVSPEASPRTGSGETGKQENNNYKLASKFVIIANIEAEDGGKAIVAGNERVIRARLADAEHFWKTDRAPLPGFADAAAKPLDQRLAKLQAQDIVFHEKLGTQGERVERIARLAREIAPLVGADADKAERAARLAKADLVSEMVGEFPELQGLMGKYYALAQGEDASVAQAIEDHYKPLGPADRVPDDPVAIAVALADKLDMLVGFWAIDEKPTGSKDPYALRRAALGVIRIVLETSQRVRLTALLRERFMVWLLGDHARSVASEQEILDELFRKVRDVEFSVEVLAAYYKERDWDDFEEEYARLKIVADRQTVDVLDFFADRLKVQLREQGARHDLVDAVFALGQWAASSFETRPAGAPQDEAEGGRADSSASPHPEVRDGASRRASKDEGARASAGRGQIQDDLLLVVRRVEALGRFLDSDDGQNLLVGYRRAANILRDEEKRSGETFDGAVDETLLAEPEEKALAAAIDTAIPAATAAVATEDFEAAMAAIAGLRAPVDAFFDHVLVNAPDAAVRANRLRLLNRIREATRAVADFSKIAG